MRCLIVQPIHPAGIEKLRAAGIELRIATASDEAAIGSLIGHCDAVITRDAGLSPASITRAPNLKLIVSHGTGVDSIAVDVATRRGIIVANTPGMNAQSVAELTLGLLIAAARRIPAADRALRAGEHRFREANQFVELFGKTALIVGWGHIGRRVGAMLRAAFDMELLVHAPRADARSVTELGGELLGNLHDALARADIVSLHAPLRPDTRGMIGRREFEALKPGAIIVNTARAGLIDEAELATALDDHRVFAAGLDLQQAGDLFCKRENVVLTPHLGGTTLEGARRTAVAAADAVIAVQNGQEPANVVNLSTGKSG